MKLNVLIQSLGDNYIYLIHDNRHACVVDPTAAEPVERMLSKNNLFLKYILNTHHHFDHVAGNTTLKNAFGCDIIGGSNKIPGVDHILKQGETLQFGDQTIHVLSTPGHTQDSLCYYFPGDPGMVFTGDTLFVAGCGRLFEGTAAQMKESFQELGQLPPDTLVYCGHDYAQENADFAWTVHEDHDMLNQFAEEIGQKRSEGLPTVPSTIGMEKKINPFMLAPSAQVFAELRKKKDQF